MEIGDEEMGGSLACMSLNAHEAQPKPGPALHDRHLAGPGCDRTHGFVLGACFTSCLDPFHSHPTSPPLLISPACTNIQPGRYTL